MNKAIKATIGGKLDNENTNLLNKFFEIPAYQRLYEWESTQIEELLNDMKKAWEPYILQGNESGADLQKSIKPYFIGNITTSIKSNKGEHDKTNGEQNKMYVLIDGQQRLTTLWFIGFYLASRECEWEKEITKRVWQNFILQDDKLRIAMPIRDKERETLESLAKKIQMSNSQEKLEFSKDLQGIHQKIINAFKCIESWFVGENGKDIYLEKFANCIYNSVCFVFVELAQNTDLNRFFVRMNNRGKQLEKHEILKARILSVIQQGGGEWQKYAKIWDLCSDMNKYIFQSASDRDFLNSENEVGEKWGIDKIISEFDDKNTKSKQDDDTPDKVESIIDFPTFLLHCFKIFTIDSLPQNFTIGKDKLLEFIDIDKLAWNDKKCKEFIVFMLRIRVLFDYFVIKNTLSDDGFAIMRFYKNNNAYQPKANSLKNLAMIQNYLRVARQGERQNYEHWLTDFLRFLDSSDLQKFNDIKEIKDFASISNNRLKLPQFLIKKKGQEEQNSTNKLQEELIKKLEAIDTEQVFKVNLKDKKIDKISTYLSKGTNTAHYWFYRLEYYLWKWGSKRDKIDNKKIKDIFDKFNEKKFPLDSKFSFDEILNSFYFRNLNSIEHIEPQSNFRTKYEWTEANINHFGNLALISPAFNSQLSNQSNKHKALDLRKKIDDGNAESLKLWLLYALYIKDGNEWTYKKSKKHLVQMLRILKGSLDLRVNV